MGDPLGSSSVSSQKQNREGVFGAQSVQYRATAESSPRCGGGSGRDVTITSFTIQAGSSGRLIHLLGSLRSSSELYSHTRRVKVPTASILHF
ncbi:hypothetical protein ACFX14_013156 [Malus domestica]